MDTFPFGKWKGVPVTQIDTAYLLWSLDNVKWWKSEPMRRLRNIVFHEYTTRTAGTRRRVPFMPEETETVVTAGPSAEERDLQKMMESGFF